MRHFESILGRLHEIRARGADVPMSIRHLGDGRNSFESLVV